jgi:hypothetical protein
MSTVNKALADIPVATLTFIGVIVGGLICLANETIGFVEFTAALALAGGGSYGIGKVRNEAGKGIKRR